MGGTTQISAPAPTQPTPQSEVSAWVNAMPQVYQTQEQYQLPMAEAQQQAQQALYPVTSGLQENLATQATQGMNSNIPDWMRQQYSSDMNAQLGNNAAAPIGADYMSRGLMQQNQNWKQYYQNMGMSLAGRQPLASPSLDYMSGFTPNSVMSGMNQNYGTAGNIYGSQLGYNSAVNAAQMGLIGAGIGAAGNVAGSALGAM